MIPWGIRLWVRWRGIALVGWGNFEGFAHFRVGSCLWLCSRLLGPALSLRSRAIPLFLSRNWASGFVFFRPFVRGNLRLRGLFSNLDLIDLDSVCGFWVCVSFNPFRCDLMLQRLRTRCELLLLILVADFDFLKLGS